MVMFSVYSSMPTMSSGRSKPERSVSMLPMWGTSPSAGMPGASSLTGVLLVALVGLVGRHVRVEHVISFVRLGVNSTIVGAVVNYMLAEPQRSHGVREIHRAPHRHSTST